MADPAKNWTRGKWNQTDGRLESPKQFGAVLELPYEPPQEYRLTAIVEPLDSPNGLLLGQRLGKRRFTTLVNFNRNGAARSALEDVDGRNVGNLTTHTGQLLQRGRLSQIVVTVREDGVQVLVDGKQIIQLTATAERFSLSDYWKTPRENAMFVGAYDCRYRFYRLSIEELKGEGHQIPDKN